ncbi:MAG: transketolase, partial [Thermotogae bacterium]
MAKRFPLPNLPESERARLEKLAKQCRGDILKMTTLAKSGHPGGSMSSIDIYLVVWSYANVSPELAKDPNRDRIV